MSLIKKSKRKIKGAYLSAGVALSMASQSAFATSTYNASSVNSEASAVAGFFVALIQGYVGYAIAVAVFIYGIFKYFQDQKLWGLFTAFGIAIAIVFVPGMLESFFVTGSDTTGA